MSKLQRALKALHVFGKGCVERDLADRRADSRDANLLLVERLFDRRRLPVRQVEHIRTPDAAQVKRMDTLVEQCAQLLLQVGRNLVGERGEANHDNITSLPVREDS